MIRVGVIADTHDILKEEVLNELKQCDYILILEVIHFIWFIN